MHGRTRVKRVEASIGELRARPQQAYSQLVIGSARIVQFSTMSQEQQVQLQHMHGENRIEQQRGGELAVLRAERARTAESN